MNYIENLGGEVLSLEEKAKELKREYYREYYKKNREKMKKRIMESNKDYWIRKAKKLEMNNGGE